MPEAAQSSDTTPTSSATAAQDGPLAGQPPQGAPTPAPTPIEGSTEAQTGQNTVRDPATGRWTSPGALQAAQEARGKAQAPGTGQDGGAAAAAAQEAARKLKVKVRGRELELSEDEIRTHLEVGLGGKEQFTEADKKLKEYDARMAAFAEDPASVMQAHGVDPVQFAIALLNAQTEYDAMTPQERLLYDREQELAARQAAVEEADALRQQEEYEADQAEQLEVLATYLPVALKNMGLPNDRRVLPLVEPYLRQAEREGHRMTPEVIGRAASLARMDLDDHVSGAFEAMEYEAIARTLGPNVMKKIRMGELNLARKGNAGSGAPRVPVRENPTPPRPQAPQGKPMTEMQWRRLRDEEERNGG